MMNVSPTRIMICLSGLISQLALAGEDKAPVSSVLADNNVTSNLLQTTFGLLAVLAIIAAAAWAVKRFGNLRTGVQGKMKVIGGVSLGTRERVVLLQVGEQQLVLGVAPGQIRTLHVLDEPLSVPDSNEVPRTDGKSGSASFALRLQSAIKGRSVE